MSTTRTELGVIIRRLVGWIYVAIGALTLSGIIGNLGPFAPAEDSPEARGMEWGVIVIPMMLLMSGTFAFAGYWAMTHPRVHRRRTIALAFVAMTCVFLAWGELRG